MHVKFREMVSNPESVKGIVASVKSWMENYREWEKWSTRVYVLRSSWDEIVFDDVVQLQRAKMVRDNEASI